MMQRIAPEGTGTQKSEMSTSPMTRATCPLSLSANNATVHSQPALIYSWGRAISGFSAVSRAFVEFFLIRGLPRIRKPLPPRKPYFSAGTRDFLLSSTVLSLRRHFFIARHQNRAARV
jgi:hypothetical protein